MASLPNSSVPGEAFHFPVSRPATALTEVFLDQYTEVEVSSESEWLSNFVEECLSSAGNCLPPSTNTNPNSSKPKNHQNPPNPQKPSIPGKPRSQRGRKPKPKPKPNSSLFRWTDYSNSQSAFTDPPLLEQGLWLADSELLHTRKEEEKEVEMKEQESEEGEDEEMKQMQPRRCSHCQAQKTPQWRAGPMGPKTLCNACGMRYFKSGRLLPEYRPAKSPTFLSFKHSNSHKKVLQMRMALMSSSTPVLQ